MTVPSLTQEDSRTLRGWVRSPHTARLISRKAQALLLAADGVPKSRIARELGLSRPTVIACVQRFETEGIDGLGRVAPGRGRKRTIPTEKVEEIIQRTLHSRPRGSARWTCRTMAREAGVSPATVQRIWDLHGLKPRRSRSPLSDDRLVERLTDVVGLLLNSPDRAVVLIVDRRSRVPVVGGRRVEAPPREPMASTLPAALESLNARVVGDCRPRRRSAMLLRFLRRLDRGFPPDLRLHVILDRGGAHDRSSLAAWLSRHSRFVLHATPPGRPWLDVVAEWVHHLTPAVPRRGFLTSVDDLIAAARGVVERPEDVDGPFVWTASVESILEKIAM